MGATGSKTSRINGIFEATEEESGGMPIYRKLDDYDVVLLYSPPAKMWIIQAAKDRGSFLKWAYLRCDPPHLPEKGPKGAWQVDDGSAFCLQDAVAISFPTQAEVASAALLAASIRADGHKVKPHYIRTFIKLPDPLLILLNSISRQDASLEQKYLSSMASLRPLKKCRAGCQSTANMAILTCGSFTTLL